MFSAEEEHAWELYRLAADTLEWCRVFLKGGSSPVWTDGKELNYLKKKIENDAEALEAKGYYPGLVVVLPPEMDVEYMKNCEEIEKKARQVLEEYQRDENYCYLAENLTFLGNIQKACLKNPPDEIMEPIWKLQEAIEKKDYLTMRKYSQGEYTIKKHMKKLKACREEVEFEIEDMNPF